VANTEPVIQATHINDFVMIQQTKLNSFQTFIIDIIKQLHSLLLHL